MFLFKILWLLKNKLFLKLKSVFTKLAKYSENKKLFTVLG
jgi:hypothetical protein